MNRVEVRVRLGGDGVRKVIASLMVGNQYWVLSARKRTQVTERWFGYEKDERPEWTWHEVKVLLP